MSARIRVAVVGGGQSCEHEVSLASAASVREALDPERFDVVALTIDPDGRWRIGAAGAPAGSRGRSLAHAVRLLSGCDVMLPVVHGPHGEDGTLAALGDLAGVPYVGSGVRAGALAMDKWATKLVAAALGVPVAAGVLADRRTAASLRYDGPVVVKPVAAGSSHGVTLVETEAALAPALELALSLDDRVLVEQVLTGREIDIAVLDRPDGTRLVSPALEIPTGPGLFDTRRKYDGSAAFQVPASLEQVQRKELEQAALALHEGLGCRGVARYDFFLTADGLVLNEVNTMPGMTAQSQVPKMYAAIGLPYADLLADLVLGAVA